VMLTIALIRLLMEPSTSFGELVAFFVVEMVVGTVVGIAMGEIMRRAFNALDLRVEGIYLVLSVALVLMTYGLTTFLHGSGFLAVYLAGLSMQRKPFVHQQNVLRFHDGLAWLMQVTMFLMLGLQVFPARLVPVAWVGILVSLFLIIVARPAAVHLSLAFSSMPFREQTLVAWAGLRGSVPIILATFPLLAGVKQADTIFHLVFFITLTSVFIQGTTIVWASHLLKIDASPQDEAHTSQPKP
jgi:potassium/hydrogen antiporter